MTSTLISIINLTDFFPKVKHFFPITQDLSYGWKIWFPIPPHGIGNQILTNTPVSEVLPDYSLNSLIFYPRPVATKAVTIRRIEPQIISGTREGFPGIIFASSADQDHFANFLGIGCLNSVKINAGCDRIPLPIRSIPIHLMWSGLLSAMDQGFQLLAAQIVYF